MVNLREYLVEKIVNTSIKDMSSIKLITSALSSLTNTIDQISFKTSVCFECCKMYLFSHKYCFFLKEMSINQIDKSVNELEKMSNGTSFVNLKQSL